MDNHVYPGGKQYDNLLRAFKNAGGAKLIEVNGVSWQVVKNGSDYAFHRVEGNNMNKSLGKDSFRLG